MIKLNHFPKSVIGLVRKANEDSIGSLTNKQTNGYGDIFVVCDGMGGHVGGATASQTAIKCILQYFEQEANPNPIIALEKAISFANQQIFGLAQQDSSLKGMGTTCTVLLCKEDKIYIAHVGDSRIYINTDNKLYRITKDHSFVQKLVDAGQLEDSEMETHPRKNELTKALGIGANVEVEVAENPILAKNGDKFLMCSDGLCGLVNDLTIENTINNTIGLDSVNELIQLAENAGGNDNISVDIIDIIQSPHSKTIFKDQGNKSLTATQVLDIPSMKGDRKLITIFKRYQVYILSTLLVLLLALGVFIYPLIKGDINSNKVNDSEKDLMEATVDTPEDNVQHPDSGIKGKIKIENTDNTNDGEVKKEGGSVSFSKTQEEYEQEETERIYRELRNKQNKAEKFLLEEAKDKIEEIKAKLQKKNYKYDKLSWRSYTQLKIQLDNLESYYEKGRIDRIKSTINSVNKKWITFDNESKAFEEIKKEANKTMEYMINLANNDLYKIIKKEIESLEEALKGYDKRVLKNKINALEKKETQVKDAKEIKKLKKKGYVKKLEIDKAGAIVYEDTKKVGKKVFYKYPKSYNYKQLNNKYKKEQKFIIKYKTLRYVKKEKCNDAGAVWFFAQNGKPQNKTTKEQQNIFTDEDLAKLAQCLGREIKTIKYCPPPKPKE